MNEIKDCETHRDKDRGFEIGVTFLYRGVPKWGFDREIINILVKHGHPPCVEIKVFLSIINEARKNFLGLFSRGKENLMMISKSQISILVILLINHLIYK